MHECVTPQQTKMSQQFDTTAVTPMRDTGDNVERNDVDNNISLLEETTDEVKKGQFYFVATVKSCIARESLTTELI